LDPSSSSLSGSKKQVEIEALGTKMKFSVQEDIRSELEGDFFDLAGELEDELTTKSSVPTEVRDVFNAFKQGVSESVAAEDFETHYDLGIAYREMGLIEDAISEFEICAKLPGRFATSSYQLGLCEIARSNWAKAQEHLDGALKLPKLDPQEKISLSYELAEVCLKLNNPQRAAMLYEEVQKLDPTFREVSERIKACRR
jgi:tetratricopeptide (TPR) repeat protein